MICSKWVGFWYWRKHQYVDQWYGSILYCHIKYDLRTYIFSDHLCKQYRVVAGSLSKILGYSYDMLIKLGGHCFKRIQPLASQTTLEGQVQGICFRVVKLDFWVSWRNQTTSSPTLPLVRFCGKHFFGGKNIWGFPKMVVPSSHGFSY